MPRKLSNLSIREVSSVSRGAGENVKILLMKRDDSSREIKAPKLAKDFDEQVAKATAALNATVKAINESDIEDREAAIAKAVSDFNQHVAKLCGEEDNGEVTMSKELEAAIAKMQADLAFAKMTDPHKAYATTMKLEGDALKKFVDADDAGREAIMKEFPPKKEKKPGEKDPDCEKQVIKLEDLPAEVVAKLAKADENEKIVKGLQEKEEVRKYEDKAVSLGLAKSQGEIIRKAYAGDAKAQDELDKLLKGLTNQIATGVVFKQFGNEGDAKATAMDELKAKAAELRKTADGAKLTDAQAFSKVLTDPANADLAKREREERYQKFGGVAA